jgi:hypothetical protein
MQYQPHMESYSNGYTVDSGWDSGWDNQPYRALPERLQRTIQPIRVYLYGAFGKTVPTVSRYRAVSFGHVVGYCHGYFRLMLTGATKVCCRYCITVGLALPD